MSSAIKDLQMDVAASLWLQPCTFDELCNRLGKPQYGMNIIVKMAEDNGWIYSKGNRLYCYKKTVKQVLNPEGYELDLQESFESDFVKSLKKQGLI